MKQCIKARLDREDQGFTLIELMVVVLIIAILIAIAIPTFFGARERSQDRGAQVNLRHALTAAKTIAADDGDYGGVNGATILGVHPTLSYPAAAGDVNEVAFAVTTTVTANDTITMAARSDSSVCFFVQDVISTGTVFDSLDPAPGAGCAAADAPGGWVNGW